MKLLFCTSRKPLAFLIRAVTWSQFSHVAIIDGDEVIEAAWPRVRRSKLLDVLKTHPVYRIAHFNTPDDVAVLDAARSQIGKPYDATALIGLLFRRDWQESDRWFCSELVAWAFDKAGFPLFRPETLHRVTPQHLWMLHP